MTIKSILIDAAHKEETRVVVTHDGILQDFDREAISVQKVKGNIYLAKVTRVEPSLQSAFIDYGQDRHGFLPFGDIHPENFNLSAEEKEKISELLSSEQQKTESDDDSNAEENEDSQSSKKDNSDSDESMSTGSQSADDEADAARKSDFAHGLHKKFAIQDVIKPGQMILVQVTKEERGNKGASMTTFISLAGKYSVLMTNTANKGGVSRKVENFRDRKILKTILSDLEVKSDRSVIIRTAGVGKKPEEIKGDYEYLNRLWQNIVDSAKGSKTPLFIHGEDDVIKRCIRDVYNEDVSEVIIEGKDAYDEVNRFIEMTMPGGDHHIVHYQDRNPIFSKFGVEQQISDLYEKEVSLKSGGSIVIDQAEALVAIDVNSGRSTKETDIERTAYQTNLEASKEIAKQLRLRDLAGLVVIDYIDMVDQKHRRQVERTLRDELKDDRARIQLGRISVFGLLELSRQRLGASLFEIITQPCNNCNGSGYVRSVEVSAIAIFRAIRNACNDRQTKVIYVSTTAEVISHIVNFKRKDLQITESNYKINIIFNQETNIGGAGFKIKKRKSLTDQEKRELKMEVETSRVNQLEIAKEHYDDFNARESDSDNTSYSGQAQRSQPRKRNNSGNQRRKDGNRRPSGSRVPNNNRKRPVKNQNKGIINSVFGMFK